LSAILFLSLFLNWYIKTVHTNGVLCNVLVHTHTHTHIHIYYVTRQVQWRSPQLSITYSLGNTWLFEMWSTLLLPAVTRAHSSTHLLVFSAEKESVPLSSTPVWKRKRGESMEVRRKKLGRLRTEVA
jgi:hypothetical protein